MFSKYNFHFSIFPPHKLTSCYFLFIEPNDSDREIIFFVKWTQNIVFLE
jgi:hypothetical protein